MTENERKNAVIELREKIIPRIRVKNLINNPDKNIKGQGILRAKAIFSNFDSSDGQKLDDLIKEFLDVARAGVRPDHIKNLANDINIYIVKKTEEMDRSVINSEKVSKWYLNWQRWVILVTVLFIIL